MVLVAARELQNAYIFLRIRHVTVTFFSFYRIDKGLISYYIAIVELQKINEVV
mgnify:CR=1 FL=1